MVQPHIGIDARLFGAHDRGIGRYVMELARVVTRLKSFRFTFFVRPGNLANEELKSWPTIEAPFPVYSMAEQVSFPRLIAKQGIDLMHFPHLNVPLGMRGPYVVTIHDLILHHFPSRYASTRAPAFFWLKYAGYRIVTRETIRRAERVVAVSAFTAEDVVSYYPWVGDKLRIICEHVDEKSDLLNDMFSDVLYTQYQPYVIVVGAFYPHKNIERLLRVWKRLAPKERLIIVGRLDVFGQRQKEVARELGILHDNEGGVIFTDHVNDARLADYYRGTKALLVPSLMEGFGLPGLEAIDQRVPVISSSSSSLPEIYGDRVNYMAVDTDERMLASLERVLPSPMPPKKDVGSKQDLTHQWEEVYRDALKHSAIHD